MSNTIDSGSSYKDRYPESWARLHEVNKISDQLQSYWIGFLTICAFIFASAMSVTHRDIFLSEPLQLPVVSVELPLGWFFISYPLLIFLLHVFLLVKYRSLLDSLHWLRALQKPDNGGHPRSIEEHLNSTILMRSLSIKDRAVDRNGKNKNRFSKFFSPILNATLILLPVLLFLVLQGKILPYQNQLIEYLYRALILAEAIVVYWAFSEYWKESGRALWLMILAMGCSLLISFYFMTSNPKYIASGYWDTWEFALPWSPILNPGNRDFVNDEFIRNEDGRGTKFLTNRNFVGAKLDYADLRKINFYGSDFRYSSMLRARLDGAVLKDSDFSGANLTEASFDGTAMDNSRFWGANLFKANFSGADLKESDLHGANLEQGIFDGSNVKRARLVGANLRQARFAGANLKDATFKGSYLGQASFLGAELKRAMLQNTILNGEGLLDHLSREGCEIRTEVHLVNCSPSARHLVLDFNSYQIVDWEEFGEYRIGLRVKNIKGSQKLFIIQGLKPERFIFETRFKNAEKIKSENLSASEKNEKIAKLLIGLKLREIKVTDLYCHPGQYKQDFQFQALNVFNDTSPEFGSANLSGAELLKSQQQVNRQLEVDTLNITKKNLVGDDLSPPSNFWSKSLREQSDAHKLEASGCRAAISARLSSNAEEVVTAKTMFSGALALKKIMCTAGTYPHVANTIIMSGRLQVKERVKEAGTIGLRKSASEEYVHLARDMLETRCSDSCPGGKRLHAHAVARLWDLAVKRTEKAPRDWKLSDALPYGDGGVPKIAEHCPRWVKFLNQQAGNDAANDN